MTVPTKTSPYVPTTITTEVTEPIKTMTERVKITTSTSTTTRPRVFVKSKKSMLSFKSCIFYFYFIKTQITKNLNLRNKLLNIFILIYSFFFFST